MIGTTSRKALRNDLCILLLNDIGNIAAGAKASGGDLLINLLTAH